MPEKLNLFLFSTSLLRDQGGSSHTKSLIRELTIIKEKTHFYTYDDISSKNHIIRMLGFGKIIIAYRKSINAYYIRYTPLVFIIVLIGFLFSGAKGFVELNAYLPEELQERKYMSKFKRWVLTALFKFDLLVIKSFKVSVISVTKEMKDELNRIGIRSYWIPNGAPSSKQEVTERSRQSDSIRVCFVGSIEPWQDYELMASVPLYIEDRKVVFDIVGDGSCMSEFKHKVSQLSLTEKFAFHGYQNKDSVQEIIKNADVCIAPLTGSRLKKTGASPLKVFEYLAMGKPVVTTDCGSNKHILNQHSMIAFAPAGSPREFASELTKLFEKSSVIPHASSEEVSKRNAKIIALFSWKNNVRRIIKIMNSPN